MHPENKGWNDKEEAHIAELMKKYDLTRIQAIHKMQREKKDGKFKAE